MKRVAGRLGIGFIAGALSMLLVVVGGPIWHHLLGHSNGFGFPSANAIGWLLIGILAMLKGGIYGTGVALANLTDRRWITVLVAFLIWGWEPARLLPDIVNGNAGRALYLDAGYAALQLIAGSFCTIAILRLPVNTNLAAQRAEAREE